jgi:RHS repeat-associated protein
VALFVQDAQGEKLVEQTVYGEAQGSANNHRGKVYQVFDGAGLVTSQSYDFKGNLLGGTRQLCQNYQERVDWSQNPTLEPEIFASSTRYDALNRPITLIAPDSSTIRPLYNEANLLNAVDVNLRGAATATSFVHNIDYDAKGQRQLIRYGNDVVTTYEYDDKTFRLIHLRTDRDNAFPADRPKGIQNLFYTYDPVGNITEIRDDAQQTIFYNGEVVSPRNQYVYDALYQLIRAEGREHRGQVADPQPEYNSSDFPRVNLPHPNDGNAMREYIELYEYDSVGNILRMIHQADKSDWIRRYDYEATNNRLRNTSLPGDPADLSSVSPRYLYDEHGSMTKMPHLSQMDWDFKDELQRVDLGGGGVAYYVYDAAGQRVRKVIERQTGTRQKERIYLGGFEIYREYNGNGSAVTLERETLHVMDDQQRIALVETRTLGDDGSPTQLVRYQFGNHLGSASLELDEAGDIISYEEYYPYGSTSYQAVDKSIKAAAKRYRYTGMERDEETGLAYHGARYYAGWLGRWGSCDPAGLVDGLNLYQYVSNQVINYIDKNGNKKNKWGESEIASAKTELVNSELFQDLEGDVQIDSFSLREEFKRATRKIKEDIKDEIQGKKLPREEKKTVKEIVLKAEVGFTRFKSNDSSSNDVRLLTYKEWGGGIAEAKTFKKENKIELYGKGENYTLDNLVYILAHEYSHIFDPETSDNSVALDEFAESRLEIFGELFSQLILCEVSGNESCRVESLEYAGGNCSGGAALSRE